MKSTLTSFLLIVPTVLFSQNYTSYFTGNPTDVVTQPTSGVCVMGGSTEDDNAMTWFLNRADGGDVLVLRASGSDGYNDYLYTDLGVTVNSVETIVFNNASASFDPYIAQKIQQAEAIWFAGGDQWDYISYWRNTPVDSLINVGISQRNIVIGGTSAGMAIQGSHYFSAQNGTVTSSTALANPYNPNVTVGSQPFLSNQHLQNVITDSHYDSPDRKGRHMVFMARILTSSGIMARGIACDEYTAVCIDPAGIAHVYGGFPTEDDNAYFLQPNCELANPEPENCAPSAPLEWNHDGKAVKVYRVKGTAAGTNTFDLNTWDAGNGGTWEDWSVVNGVLSTVPGTALNCATSGIIESDRISNLSLLTRLAVNGNDLRFYIGNIPEGTATIRVSSALGEIVDEFSITQANTNYLFLCDYAAGMYFFSLEQNGKHLELEKLVVH